MIPGGKPVAPAAPDGFAGAMSPQPPSAGTGARLARNAPLSEASAGRLVAAATAHAPGLIIDHGCGWGTLLLDALTAAPEARGTGIDVHGPDIDRARVAAERRGLAGRVRFVAGSSADHGEPADLLVSVGAYQAFGTLEDALARLADRLNPGGRLLFGSEYWQAPPTTEQLTHLWDGASVDDGVELPDLIDLVHAAGWRVLDLHDSTRSEFDAFEVGHLREREEWLLDHPDHPVRDELDREWSAWLRGRRLPMGFVTLLLGR